ncbi:GDSL-type esterase/lipase family protein [Rariglobus hedericola]|uniref:SGNH hydrolase-type esterase domain-containing protein n=1 Tax=Rariglobus hedericola TaxID=2597822 RepID=A0A556QPK3_9BACT|nr:GDSL-type esterase/lipase family protein [Rariglobus hedericola]TSJ78559.1 hypothetical protein FPL22_04465 [Rariglobus hedericola]
MKLPLRPLLALFAGLLAFNGDLPAQTGPTPYPDPKNEAAWPGVGPIRTGAWMSENRAYYWTQRAQDQGGVVFVGDSLIGGWKDIGAAFPGLKIIKRGVGGDTSRGTLFRFQEDVVDLNPRAIVFCVGTNDLSAHGRPEDVISNLGTMVDIARRANPALPIIICTIPPRNVPKAPVQPGALPRLNALLKQFAAGKPAVAVVDLFPAFATPAGEPDPAYIKEDGIHFAAPAYEKWAALLRPVFDSSGIK